MSPDLPNVRRCLITSKRGLHRLKWAARVGGKHMGSVNTSRVSEGGKYAPNPEYVVNRCVQNKKMIITYA